MLIGEVATRSGVPTRTIRFYEQAGVLTPPARSPAGYRIYSEGTLAELVFVRRAQRLGLSLDEIREILSLGRSGRAPCGRVAAMCETHLANIEMQMKELRAFQRHLREAQIKAKAGCGFTREGFCRAIMGCQ